MRAETSPVARRGLWGVVLPATNTAMAHDVWAIRPAGLNFHLAGVFEPPDFYTALDSDARMRHYRSSATRDAVRRALLADPELVIMWMSSSTMHGGSAAVQRFADDFAHWCGDVPFAFAGEATIAAAKELGAARVSLITPYWPETESHLRDYFETAGIEVAGMASLDVGRSADIVRASPDRIVAALRSLTTDDSDIIIQLGAGMTLQGIAPTAHLWLGRPLLAFNPTVLWWLLRRAGIPDRFDGHGTLLEEH